MSEVSRVATKAVSLTALGVGLLGAAGLGAEAYNNDDALKQAARIDACSEIVAVGEVVDFPLSECLSDTDGSIKNRLSTGVLLPTHPLPEGSVTVGATKLKDLYDFRTELVLDANEFDTTYAKVFGGLGLVAFGGISAASIRSAR